MASILWNYAKIPLWAASGLGVLGSSALYYFQKYVAQTISDVSL